MSLPLDVIINRRSIRSFVQKEVEVEKLEAIVAAAMYAPSARNTKAWEFVIVTDKGIIEKLGSMKPHSLHAKKAGALIVICSSEWLYWLEDVSIVAAHIMLESTHQGLGSCMVQAYMSMTSDGTDAEKYVKEILAIPTQIRVLGFVSIGYPDITATSHKESEIDKKKIHTNNW